MGSRALLRWLNTTIGRGILFFGGAALAAALVLAVDLAPRRTTERVPGPPTAGLYIQSATYGGNCRATAGNATTDAARSCNGRTTCDYVVDVERLHDPAPGCPKDFVIEYQCLPDTTPQQRALPGEAGLKSTLNLTCAPAVASSSSAVGLHVQTATYGGNCRAAAGNATLDVAQRCDGKVSCDYVVNVEQLRDPAPGCGKDFVVDYQCAHDPTPLRGALPAEAGFRSVLHLQCEADK
jgi:hypothetical protein